MLRLQFGQFVGSLVKPVFSCLNARYPQNSNHRFWSHVSGRRVSLTTLAHKACRALRQEGYTVVLVNSNPATIMTDPDTADITYIEPLTVESVSAIIRKEKPDALLPTVGGQTALNVAIALADSGSLKNVVSR